MKYRSLDLVRVVLGLALLASFSARAADQRLLWQIGQPDHNNAEFALAPDGYAKFKDDAVFVVGRSDAKRDWPYIHPGPSDTWAGRRAHTFLIIFGVKQAVRTGTCKLEFDLVDT